MVPIALKKHIAKAIRNIEEKKACKVYNETMNNSCECEDCKIYYPNRAVEYAHLSSRKIYLKVDSEND